MPSLLSLSKFAKNNSLHSFTSHSLADLSNLASVPGEEMLSQGIDAKGRGQEGKPNAPGQHFPPQGQAARSPQGELGSDWGAQLDPSGMQDQVGDQSTVASSRGNKEEERDEGDQYTQGLFLKQLQQQRQQKQDSFAQDPRARDSTPPRNPRHEPDQARARLASGDPRTHQDLGAALDPRAVSGSPQQEQQGRGDQESPDEGATKPSTFLSDLQQAIEPAVRDKDSR